MLEMGLDEINDKTVEGLKATSKAEVDISIKTRVTDTRAHTDVNLVVTSSRASRVSDADVKKLQTLGDVLVLQRLSQTRA